MSAALVLMPASASLQSKPAGLVPDRVAVIDSGLQRYVDDNRVAGIVALVLQDGKPVYEKAFGWADKETGRRMTTDTIFRIASQTKALTSVAIMQLIEEGRLSLARRAGDFLPTFAKTTVATARMASGVVTEPARRPITIRDLLTHTAGISYGTDSVVSDLYAAKGLGPAAGFGHPISIPPIVRTRAFCGGPGPGSGQPAAGGCACGSSEDSISATVPTLARATVSADPGKIVSRRCRKVCSNSARL